MENDKTDCDTLYIKNGVLFCRKAQSYQPKIERLKNNTNYVNKFSETYGNIRNELYVIIKQYDENYNKHILALKSEDQQLDKIIVVKKKELEELTKDLEATKKYLKNFLTKTNTIIFTQLNILSSTRYFFIIISLTS